MCACESADAHMVTYSGTNLLPFLEHKRTNTQAHTHTHTHTDLNWESMGSSVSVWVMRVRSPVGVDACMLLYARKCVFAHVCVDVAKLYKLGG